MQARTIIVAVAAIALALGANVATADPVIWDTSWTGQPGASAGSFQDPLNWPGGNVADSFSNVTFDLPCDTTEIHWGTFGGFSGGLNTVNSMGLLNGNWTFDLDDGTGSLTMLDRLALAPSDGQDAHLTIKGGGTVITTSMVHLSNGSDIPGSIANSSITITGLQTRWEALDYIDLGWNGTGAVYVNDSAVWTLAGAAYIGIGEGSHGILEITGGATSQIGYIALGRDGATSDGRIGVSGIGSSLNVSDAINVGQNGTGLLQVDDSAQVVAAGLVVGGQVFLGDTPYTGVGTVLISGKGSVTANVVLVDSIGTDSSILVTGAESQLHSTGLMCIGTTGGTGHVTADQSGQINIDGDLTIGNGGLSLSRGSGLFVGGGTLLLRGGEDVSSLSIQDSSVNSYTQLIIGSDSGSGKAVVDIAGASNFAINAIDRNLYVGQFGNGELNIRDGASMLMVQGWAYVGSEASAAGLMSVTGPGSTFTLDVGPLTVGGNGNGTLEVRDGGMVLINNGELWAGTGSGSNGAVVVSGGTLTEQSVYASVIGSVGQGLLTVENGGQVSLSHTHIGGDWGGSSTGSGTVTVRDAGSSLNTYSMVVGIGGSGTLLVENGGLVNVTGTLSVAWGDSGVGAVTVQNGGQIEVGDAAHIGGDFGGSGGIAALDVLNGGQMNVHGQMLVGISAGGNGAVRVSGSGSTLNVNGNGGVGNVVGVELGVNDGVGNLSVLDGGKVNVTWAFNIGGNTTGEGQATVDGPGSVLEIGRELIVGREANGILSIQNGGSVNLTGATDGYDVIMIGNSVEGTVNVTGAGSSLVGGRIILGAVATGSGTLNVGDGAFVIGNKQSAIGYYGLGVLNLDDRSIVTSAKGTSPTSTSAILGQYAGASGEVTLTNTSGWNLDGTINVGWFGRGELNIFSGSRVESMDAIIGRVAGSSGTALIQQTQDQANGYAATWSIHHDLSVGGAMDAEGGRGRLTVDGSYAFMSVGYDLGGGTLRVWQNGEVNLTNGGRIAVGSDAYGNEGWLVVTEDGTVDLYGGKITGAGVRVRSGGVLAGSGTITGNVIINSGGLLSPGHSPGTLTIDGNLTLNGLVQMEVFGSDGSGANDLIDITGNLSLDGTLNVAAPTGFAPGTYTLANYSGILTGAGLTLGTMPPGLTYALASCSGHVTLAAYALGDTNHDGLVNALDIDAIYHHFNAAADSQWKVATDGLAVGQQDVTYELRTYFHTNYADANLDRKTDFVDFQVLLDRWQASGSNIGWAQGDFDGSNKVDFLDFQKLLDYWNPGGWNFAPAQTPEPASLSLLLLGGLALLRRKKT